MSTRPLTLADVRRWPPTVDVGTAAKALGVSRSSAYAAISAGTFPAAVITVGHRKKILTHSLISVLEGTSSAASSA